VNPNPSTSPATPALQVSSTKTPVGDGARKRIAAIDIGSNSIRQIIADVSSSGAIRVVDEMKAAPRLGAGLESGGELSQTAMDLALDVLGRMATLAQQLGAERVEAVATSAVREAKNGATFLSAVRQKTGLKVRVLSGEDEARLAFQSALAHFELGRGRAVVMDIGGGSLELALSAEGLVERLVSLPFGALRLTEQFLRDDAGAKGIEKLRKHVRDEVRRALPLRDWRGADVIGSGGTFTNLAGMYLARQGMRAARTVHGTRIPRVDVEHILLMLQAMTPEERLAVPGLNSGRADIIVAGLAVAAEVLARVEPRTLAASAYGIREGILLDVARVEPRIADPGEARARSVLQFAERCHYEEPHARHVQRLALQLFDAIGSRLGCKPADRAVLADAAMLHDVGYHINYDGHHKHSLHLILHADLLGISPEDQIVIAHVARYHRGREPSKSRHTEYGELDPETRKRIKRLAAILRIADGFDRGHIGAVDRLKVRWGARSLRITPIANSRAKSLRLEIWGASRKSGLLEELVHVPVQIVDPSPAVKPDSAPKRATPGAAKRPTAKKTSKALKERKVL
jgi:exopolyphosphatase/guanosine-5'-triphosphate,3'-diphosphate pyrophosphatase